jgi:hypothetical protein
MDHSYWTCRGGRERGLEADEYRRCRDCFAIEGVDFWPCPGFIATHRVAAFVRRMRAETTPPRAADPGVG